MTFFPMLNSEEISQDTIYNLSSLEPHIICKGVSSTAFQRYDILSWFAWVQTGTHVQVFSVYYCRFMLQMAWASFLSGCLHISFINLWLI